MPVCTDLLTIGDGTVIRKDSFFTGYRAHAGVIQTGPVTLGKDVFVGEATVLDIDTSMGDGAQLGHASSLHAGQAVPAGERWHGSPAQPTDVDYRAVAPAHVRHPAAGRLRASCSWLSLLLRVRCRWRIGGAGPAAHRGPAARTRCWTRAGGLHELDASTSTRWSSPLVLFFGAVLVGLARRVHRSARC